MRSELRRYDGWLRRPDERACDAEEAHRPSFHSCYSFSAAFASRPPLAVLHHPLLPVSLLPQRSGGSRGEIALADALTDPSGPINKKGLSAKGTSPNVRPTSSGSKAGGEEGQLRESYWRVFIEYLGIQTIYTVYIYICSTYPRCNVTKVIHISTITWALHMSCFMNETLNSQILKKQYHILQGENKMQWFKAISFPCDSPVLSWDLWHRGRRHRYCFCLNVLLFCFKRWLPFIKQRTFFGPTFVVQEHFWVNEGSSATRWVSPLWLWRARLPTAGRVPLSSWTHSGCQPLDLWTQTVRRSMWTRVKRRFMMMNNMPKWWNQRGFERLKHGCGTYIWSAEIQINRQMDICPH